MQPRPVNVHVATPLQVSCTGISGTKYLNVSGIQSVNVVQAPQQNSLAGTAVSSHVNPLATTIRPLLVVNMFLVKDFPSTSAGGRYSLFIIHYSLS